MTGIKRYRYCIEDNGKDAPVVVRFDTEGQRKLAMSKTDTLTKCDGNTARTFGRVIIDYYTREPVRRPLGKKGDEEWQSEV